MTDSALHVPDTTLTLDGAVSWRSDAAELMPAVKELAKELGYR